MRRAAQRRIEQELGVPYEDCPLGDMVYLTRILYSAPSAPSAPSSGQNGGEAPRWGEHELDYILFLRAREGFRMRPDPNEVTIVNLASDA